MERTPLQGLRTRNMKDSGLEKNFQVADHPVQYFTYTVQGTKTQKGSVICLRSKSQEWAEPGLEGDGNYQSSFMICHHLFTSGETEAVGCVCVWETTEKAVHYSGMMQVGILPSYFLAGRFC